MAAPTTEAQPRKLLKVPALPLNVEQQNQPSSVLSKPDITTTTVKVAATARETITTAESVGGGGGAGPGGGGGNGIRLFLKDDCSDVGHDEALPRSGSAPCSSAMALANPCGTTCLPSCQPADAVWSLLGRRSKVDCPAPKPEENLAKPARSCWDERKDAAMVSVDAATPPHDGAASTGATSMVTSETEQKHPMLKQSSSSKNPRELNSIILRSC